VKTILVFVLFATSLCWLMFSPVYKHVLVVRQAVLQKEVDYLLEVGASGAYGYIDGAMIAASRTRLDSYGMDGGAAEYQVSTTSGAGGTSAASPAIRGTGIGLTIRYPYERLFEIDRLLGMTPPDPAASMSASGLKMSEYVP